MQVLGCLGTRSGLRLMKSGVPSCISSCNARPITLASWKSGASRLLAQAAAGDSAERHLQRYQVERMPHYPSNMMVKGTMEALQNVEARKDARQVILDMEDAVSMARKAEVRQLLKTVLQRGKVKSVAGQLIVIRINSLHDHPELCKKDVSELLMERVHALAVPKLDLAQDVADYSALLDEVELQKGMPLGRTQFLVVLETARSFFGMVDIISSGRRNCSVALGMEDFATDTGGEATHKNAAYQRFQTRTILASHLHGLSCSMSPVLQIDDLNLLLRIGLNGRERGMTGMVCLTPAHVAVAQHLFHKEEPASGTGTGNGSSPASPLQTPAPIKDTCPTLTIGSVLQEPHGEKMVRSSLRPLWEALLMNNSGILSNEKFGNHVPHNLQTILAVTVMPHFGESSPNPVLLGCKDATQHMPLRFGDGVRTFVRLEKITPAGEYSRVGDKNATGVVVETQHSLVNQLDQLCFTVKCATHLPGTSAPAGEIQKQAKADLFSHDFTARRVMEQRKPQDIFTWKKQPVLCAGNLFVHRKVRSLLPADGFYLGNLVHDSRGSKDGVHPAFVLSATLSHADLEIGEVAHEEVTACTFTRDVKPGNTITSASYVRSVSQHPTNQDLEEIVMTTVGFVDVDVSHLRRCPMPDTLFEDAATTSAVKVNEICAAFCPFLLGHIAVVATRNLLRLKPEIQHSLQEEADLQLARLQEQEKWFAAKE